MTKFVMDGHDLSPLFDMNSPKISFSEDPRDYIPTTGSIIYSVWNQDEEFIYIGISGLQCRGDTSVVADASVHGVDE